MLKVNKISKWYGRKLAVHKVSFDLEKGEVLAFIGPNGAGKSTSMRIITGFIPSSEGSVIVDGHDIDTEPLAAKAVIGYLPENAPLYETMTITSFLRFVAEIRGFWGSEKRKRVDKAIDTCFLQPVRNQTIGTLSKGYKHRTCFAQAILHDPDLLVLDEPTDGLDPNQKREVRNLIKTMGESKAIIISTHILEEVEAVASRVVLIDKGLKVFDGAPVNFKKQSEVAGTVLVELFNKKQKDVTQKFSSLSCIDKCVREKERKETVVYRLYPSRNSDTHSVCNAIFDLIKKENWELDQFDIEGGRLDEVFSKMTIPEQEA